jgi:hypothetical protein
MQLDGSPTKSASARLPLQCLGKSGIVQSSPNEGVSEGESTYLTSALNAGVYSV